MAIIGPSCFLWWIYTGKNIGKMRFMALFLCLCGNKVAAPSGDGKLSVLILLFAIKILSVSCNECVVLQMREGCGGGHKANCFFLKPTNCSAV